MADDEMKKYYFAIIGIVVIVAIVGVVNGLSGNKAYKVGAGGESDLVGQAVKKLPKPNAEFVIFKEDFDRNRGTGFGDINAKIKGFCKYPVVTFELRDTIDTSKTIAKFSGIEVTAHIACPPVKGGKKSKQCCLQGAELVYTFVTGTISPKIPDGEYYVFVRAVEPGTRRKAETLSDTTIEIHS